MRHHAGRIWMMGRVSPLSEVAPTMKHALRSALCCVLLLLSAPALADSVIIGTVMTTDTRKPIADVVVTATSPNLMGEQVVVTDAEGNYRIPQLPPGVYSLRFDKESYRPFLRGGIQVRLDRTVRVNVQMLPESFAEEMIVVTGNPSPPLDFGAIGRSISDFFGGGRKNTSPPPPPPPPPSSNPTPAPPPPPERTATLPQNPFSDMYFQSYGVNPTIDTEEERFSTFSVDVDRASYALARGYLERGAMPDEQAVRVEEFVNSFDYGYKADPEAPFSVHVEGFPSPSRKGYHVVHIGLKARDVSREERKPAHLVFVIDVSGSMNIENRLGLVKRALKLLVEELDERDRVSIAVYGSTARPVLGPTSAVEKHKLFAAIDGLHSDGATNAQAGIELGYAIASEHLIQGGINRVILCSDGVANNGITDADGIWERVRAQAAKGITLTTVGFGMGNYNDVLMERLAQVGEGNYSYVDQLEEARRIFVQNLTGTLQVVAKDVKLQLEFDRKAVARYRLVGYENRVLTKEQFADDRVDAGEVGAGHSVTAIYEVKLREPAEAFATLRIRYKAPEGGDSKELEKHLPSSILRPAYGRTAPPTRLSYVAAAFAEKLRGSYWVRTLSWPQLVSLWEELDEPLRDRPDVRELGSLIRKAHGLDRRTDRFEQLAPVVSMDFDRVPVIK
ncbi:Ca-activated chloride channel family protein [Archangium gephyra]|uniref:Ca-activated chloride channel family protein n=1 Tax=Archangium gephyra TaxID=48 RepID=A0AAC8TGG4_9BACT|nr:von Willebrand factor type A domain protein [Archangium gephyra]REG35867.1 Ca-activated chloride channel family protein [Archangium gephyra]